MLKEVISTSKDLYVDQGDTYYQSITISNPNGTPLNLTGWTLTAIVKRYHNTGTTYNMTVEVVTAAAGIIALSMTSAVTATLKNSKYVYAVVASDGTSNSKILHGQLLVTPI